MPPKKPTNVEELRALSKKDLKTFNKADLVDIILATIVTTGKPPEGIECDTAQSLAGHIIESKQDIKQIKADQADMIRFIRIYSEKVEEFTLRVNSLEDMIFQQNMLIEQLDYKHRSKDLVINEVPETSWLECNDDKEKVGKIFNKLAPCDDEIRKTPLNFSVKRLGLPRTDGTKRPILVRLDSQSHRNLLISKSKVSGRMVQFPNIKLKKDQHPAIKREWKRLYDLERSEMEKSNEGLVFDKQKRRILRDGETLDFWRPNFITNKK